MSCVVRATHGDQIAAESLHSLLQSHQGTISERMFIGEALIDLKFLDSEQPCRIWTGEELSKRYCGRLVDSIWFRSALSSSAP